MDKYYFTKNNTLPMGVFRVFKIVEIVPNCAKFDLIYLNTSNLYSNNWV